MSNKVLRKGDLQKRFKISEEKFSMLVADGTIEEKEIYSETDADKIKMHRKRNPLSREDIEKRFKITREQFDLLRENRIVEDRAFYSESGLEALKSFTKLRRLGYSDTACIKVLKEVGLPEDENLFENPDYIQLKDLAEQTGISERTIKFYEKSSIILKPKVYRNKRFYREETSGELELIRDLQMLGYKLNAISRLLALYRDKTAEGKKEINALISELESKKQLADSIIKKLKG